jgi:membrane peptidoglycan carboxypeptidase
VHQHVPEPVRRVVPSGTAQELRTALRGVVYPGGTGETTALVGFEVAGKTGTARRAGPDGYIPGSYTASFTSLFPAEDPQLVMVVKLDDPEGRYGGLTAAPVTREVLQQLLAAETGALDRAPLAGESTLVWAERSTTRQESKYVLPWPLHRTVPDSTSVATVPDITGLSLRAAANELHSAGLVMQLSGWGRVVGTEPSHGTELTRGAIVKVVAREVEGGNR